MIIYPSVSVQNPRFRQDYPVNWTRNGANRLHDGMKYLLIAAALFGLSACATTPTNKQKVATKCGTLGLKFPSYNQLLTIFGCMDPNFITVPNANDMTTAVMNCGMDFISDPNVQGTLFSIYASMETCLGNCKNKTDTMSLAMKILKKSNGTVGPDYTIYQTKMKAWKANKLPNATILENLYGWANTNLLNKTKISSWCTNMVKKGWVMPCEWSCILGNGKTFVDFAQYSCSKLTPPASG